VTGTTPTSPGGISAGATPGDSRYPTRVLLTMTAIALLLNYVETMVIPGVPVIQKDFSTTATIASWITSAFLIVGSAVAPLFGRLGDNYGKKRMILICLVFYTIGVGMAGFSPSIYVLLLARAIQGVGFAVVPLGLAIITETFPREKIAQAQGIISGTFAIGAALGLIVGAFIIQNLGWQYAFHSALILSVILFILVVRVIRRDPPGPKRKIDYLGALILMSGITLLLVYATEGPALGWLATEEIASLVLGTFLTVFFFLFERKRPEPLIRLDLLRIRDVLVANLVVICAGIVMFLLFFAIVYYAELPKPNGLDLGIIATGLTIAPAALAMLVVGPLAGRIVAREGPKPMVIIGALALMAGLALLIVNRSTSLDVSLDAVVAFVGVISVIVPIINMVSVSLPKDTVGVGLGINTMLRNLGGAIGPIVATAVMATYTAPLIVGGETVPAVSLPTALAFNIVFGIGLGLTALVIILGASTKNYTFRTAKVKPLQPPPLPPPAVP
jgi:EmrB/QacA subfamily drug resistance transporter